MQRLYGSSGQTRRDHSLVGSGSRFPPGINFQALHFFPGLSVQPFYKNMLETCSKHAADRGQTGGAGKD
jgi:hypothetical protein